MAKLIIIDGMDNTGKSTLINRFCQLCDILGKSVYTTHLTAPDSSIPKENIFKYQHDSYIQFVKNLIDIDNTNNYDYIIIDRGWISEYVYGQIYRDRNSLEITTDNLALDCMILNHFTSNNVFLFVLIGFTEHLLQNEDGKSLAKENKFLMDKEKRLFKDGYDYSIIQNKEIINVSKENKDYSFSYKDILPDVIKNILII